MKKIFFCLLSLLLISNTSLSATELALNWKAEPDFGGFYAALEILKKQGIDLKVIEGGSSSPTLQMLAAKQIPYAIVNGDELITARDRGMDLVAIFAVYQGNPLGIMVRDDSPWKSIEQLVHAPEATIAAQLGAPYVSFLKKKYPDMKAKLVPYQGGIGPFLSQKNYAQQCFLTAEPLAANKAGVKTRGFSLDDVGFSPYLAVLAVHRDTIKQKRAEIGPLIAGIRQGWENYLQNPTPANKLMFKINPSMTLETFEESGRAQLKFVKPTKDFAIGTMTKDRWKNLSQQLKELGLIKSIQ